MSDNLNTTELRRLYDAATLHDVAGRFLTANVSKAMDFARCAHNAMPALLARIEKLESSELAAIGERDEWSDLFDRICGYLGVETEYSNVRSGDDVAIECREAIGALQGKLAAYRSAMRRAIFNAGGIAEEGVSDKFLLENVPAEMALLHRQVRAFQEEDKANIVKLDALLALANEWKAEVGL